MSDGFPLLGGTHAFITKTHDLILILTSQYFSPGFTFIVRGKGHFNEASGWKPSQQHFSEVKKQYTKAKTNVGTNAEIHEYQSGSQRAEASDGSKANMLRR